MNSLMVAIAVTALAWALVFAIVQSLNKEFGTTILISETTYAAIKDDFECRLMPQAQLRGKAKQLRFYEVVSMKTDTVAAV